MRKSLLTMFLSLVCFFSIEGYTSTLTYTYDPLGRLTQVTHDNGIVVSYTYDAMGNRTRKSVTIPPTLDTDNDGIADVSDPCPFGPCPLPPIKNPVELTGSVTTPYSGFTDPFGLVIHPAGGTLYVPDHLGNKIRQINLSTNTVTTLAGPGAGITAGGSTDGVGDAARFASPIALAIDSRGNNLYVVDEYTHKIRKIVIATGTVSTFAGPENCGLNCPFGDTDGVGEAARFFTPEGIAMDPTDTNLYVADAVNNKIRKIEIATRRVTTFAGPAEGDTTAGDADGVGNIARFFSPVGLSFYKNANEVYLYVADGLNNKIRRIDLRTREVTTPFGPLPGTTEPGDADATGNNARFWAPEGLAIDPTGTYLYVAERDNRKIRKIVLATGAVTTLAGPPEGSSNPVEGLSSFGDADGRGSAVRFGQPVALAISPDGTTLYISDANNNKIRKIQ